MRKLREEWWAVSVSVRKKGWLMREGWWLLREEVWGRWAEVVGWGWGVRVEMLGRWGEGGEMKKEVWGRRCEDGRVREEGWEMKSEGRVLEGCELLSYLDSDQWKIFCYFVDYFTKKWMFYLNVCPRPFCRKILKRSRKPLKALRNQANRSFSIYYKSP